MTTDFLDDERRRLAYADRAETRERNRSRLLPDGHLGECVLSVDDGWRCAIGCRDAQIAAAERSLASGTGRHSRKEMEQATTCTWRDDNACKVCGETPDIRDGEREHGRGCYAVDDIGGGIDVVELCQCARCKWERVDADDRSAHANMNLPARPPSVVAGVSFTSVPQLCAAYEYALETLKRLYQQIDLKQHAWQSEQDVMRDARSLL